MAKSYVDELADWVESRPTKRRRRDEAAVAFLAVKENVEAALAVGYALFTIWEHMSNAGKMKFSYETFRSHARRFIKPKEVPSATTTQPQERKKTSRLIEDSTRAATVSGVKPNEKPTAIPSFTFKANPDKMDLL